MASNKPNKQRKPQPWDQRPDETNKAYHRFCLYRDMGPDRSLAKLVQKLGKAKNYKVQLENWSVKHDWQDRVKAYDAHELERQREEREEIRERGRQLYVDNLNKLIHKHLNLALEDAEIDADGNLKVHTNSAQAKLLVDAIEKAGVTVPKEIQIQSAPKRLVFGIFDGEDENQNDNEEE